MKKSFLLLLLCAISQLSGFAYSNVTEDVTMYAGETLMIDPYSLAGVKPSSSASTIISFSGVGTGYSGQLYIVSDASIFSVTNTSYKVGDRNAQVFTLQALKTGYCTFSTTVSYIKKTWTASGWYTENFGIKVTYNITVIEKPKVVSITIPYFLTLTVGECYMFSPIIAEAGATTSLSWSSTNSNVATVSNGTVQAIGVGTASIICTADNGVSAQCLVTVNEFVDPLPAIKDTTVNLTVTVGVPFVITPIQELNIAGGDASTPTPYIVSDPSACTVVSTDCAGWNGGIYRIYTITPEKAGVFVFKETCSCTIGYAAAPSGIYTKTATATYIVNVVEALPTVLGDMDGDGKVTINDVRKVFDIYLEENAK